MTIKCVIKVTDVGSRGSIVLRSLKTWTAPPQTLTSDWQSQALVHPFPLPIGWHLPPDGLTGHPLFQVSRMSWHNGNRSSYRPGEGSGEKATGRMEHLRWPEAGTGEVEPPNTAATKIRERPREAAVTGKRGP